MATCGTSATFAHSCTRLRALHYRSMSASCSQPTSRSGSTPKRDVGFARLRGGGSGRGRRTCAGARYDSCIGRTYCQSSEALKHLSLLAPKATHFLFWTGDDDKTRNDPALRSQRYGTLEDHADRLADLNARGAGVFVCVAEMTIVGGGASRTLCARAPYSLKTTTRVRP